MAYSSEVHHLIPVSKGGSIFDPKNVIAVCKSCHATLDSLQKMRKYGRGGGGGTVTALPVRSGARLGYRPPGLERLQWKPRLQS